ncbi:MAG TPA: ABC transporter permease [Elusimicrobiota bacterium]|nr:ABC transporter permease [Elusimicrobiota bacterium]
MIKSPLNLLRRLLQNRYMIQNMVVRDIRARYVGSFLGLFWTLIHPLSQLVIYYFVFAVVLKVRLGPEFGGTHFAVWLIAGLLPWMLFAEVVGRSPNALMEQAGLIKKTVFPSEILPFCHLSAALVNHFIALILLVTYISFFDAGLTARMSLLAPYLIFMGLFAVGLSWFLSSLNVFLRDVGQVLGVALQIWFYLTPVIYPQNAIPSKYLFWLKLNPMYHAVDGYRMALLGRVLPDTAGLLFLIASALSAFLIGGLLFKKLKPSFADVL